MPPLRERIVGALTAGALGDALGSPFEGAEPDPSRTLPSRSGFTDDTELTLATCEAILTAQGIDLEVIATHYATCFRKGGVHGAGSSTTKALRDLVAGAHWALAGARGERAAGAGAAMRVAPLAFLTSLESGADRRLIRDFSRITHHHEEAYSAAVAVVAALQGASSGLSGTSMIKAVIRHTPDSVVRDRLMRLVERLPAEPDTIVEVTGRSGYAASVVPFAIVLAAEATDLVHLLTTVIRAGGDTDTAGSIAGQIVGARLGVGAIPSGVADGVMCLSAVRQVAESFASFVEENSV